MKSRSDQRIHGTTHQRPIDRFADEARCLVPTTGHPSFLSATVRERAVARNWLVLIDANRYSVPYAQIGTTVQVVHEGGNWVIRHRCMVVAPLAVLAGRAQLRVLPKHGPGAAARNASARRVDAVRVVEVRDAAVYEQLCELAEAA